VAVGVSATLLVGLDSKLTFFSDEFELLLVRRGWGADDFLHPWHENILLGPALVYRVVLLSFGMNSALPFYVAAISTFLLSGVLLFVWLRRRVGEWAALLGAILILFLGGAFEDLLFAFQIGFFGSMAAGLGMLIALDRDDEQGDRIACGLLVVSLAFSSVGIAFAAGAAADLVLSPRSRRARAYVALLPLFLYAVWWLGWGHLDQSHASLHNLEHAPGYVFDAASAATVTLLGLATGDGSEPDQPHLIWGKLVLIAAVLFAIGRLAMGWRPSRGMLVVLAIAFAFFFLPAIVVFASRAPTSSRYQYPGAVFLLLIAGEALRGVRIPRLALVVAALGTGAAVSGGISLMNREYDQRWLPTAVSLRSSLAGIDVAGQSMAPDYIVDFRTVQVSPSTYLAATDADGSPGYSERELLARPELDRAAADGTLAVALGLELEPLSAAGPTEGCQTLRASDTGLTGVTLISGGFRLSNDGEVPAEVLLSRFASGFSVDLGSLAPGSTVALVIPADRSTQPWTLGLTGDGAIRLCTAASG
jgi:hypothetical protein